MAKTIDEHFTDWFNEPFGYGYGSGETPILYQLKAMAELLHWNEDGDNWTYDYKELVNGLGEATAWLLINALCNSGTIGYGSSPRFGWFFGGGKSVIDYIKSHEVEDMYETVNGYDSDYVRCFDDYCSCHTKQMHHRCKNNPFWNNIV